MNKWIEGKHIMIVDDESDLTLSCRTSLDYHGFVVDTFNEPKEALSNFKSNYYDLVILDIIMDDLNGFELYREIKKIEPMLRLVFSQPVTFTSRRLEARSMTHYIRSNSFVNPLRLKN